MKELFEQDIMIQSVQLQIGDYLIGESICVERKSVQDFIDSLIDKRIFGQLSNMKREYKKVLLIVEGGEEIYGVRKVHPNAINGLIATILMDYNIPIFFSKNEKQTADFLITLLNRMEKDSTPVLKTLKEPYNKNSILESIVQSIPNLGVKNSKILLTKFKTVKNLFNQGVENLGGVEGIGEKTAKKIIEIVETEYED